MARLPVLVSGGGLGGLSLALCLAQKGVPFHMFERQSTLSTKKGPLMVLGTPTVDVLKGLGLEKELKPLMEPISTVQYLREDSQSIARVDFRAMGLTHVVRSNLLFALAKVVRAQVPQECIHLNKELLNLEQRESSVIAHFTDGTSLEGSFLVGADGMRSTVRRLSFGSCPLVHDGTCWFGATPVDSIQDKSLLDSSTLTTVLAPGRSFGMRRINRTLHWWLVASEKTVSMPWHDESTSLSLTQDLDGIIGIAEHTVGWSANLVEVCKHNSRVRKIPLFHRPTLRNKWNMGRVVLMGDAAHPILPYKIFAQGANTTVEDAALLGETLKRLHEGQPSSVHIESAMVQFFKSRAVPGINAARVANLVQRFDNLKRGRRLREWFLVYVSPIVLRLQARWSRIRWGVDTAT